MDRTSGPFEIRPFTQEDYNDVATVHNAVYPDNPMTAQELRRDDENRDEHCRCERWVVTLGGTVVAHGGFCQWPDTFQEGEYSLIGGVVPEHRGKGIGSALYALIERRLRAIDAKLVRSHGRADRDSSIRFLTARGFAEFMRERDWALDPRNFDSEPFRGLLDSLQAQGVEIVCLRDLRDDPQRNRKLYDMINAVLLDAPGGEYHQRLPFERWVELHIDTPEILEDGYYVAKEKDEYVGKTHFVRYETDDTLFTKLTGVIPSHRRRGIALALKVRSIMWARANGFSSIRTDNESGNLPMMTLNRRLGFKELPEWIFYEKRFS